MAKASAIKPVPEIEFTVISNAFGFLIAFAGLLGGVMVSQRSFDYWLDDILPIVFVVWMLFKLFRSFLTHFITYQDMPAKNPGEEHPAPTSVTPEPVIAGQITSTPSTPSPEQVLEEVAKRIASKKKNKEKNNQVSD